MAPTLYMIPASGPVRAVILCAEALGVKLDMKVVNLLTGEQFKDEFVKKNPAATVPVLVEDDGFVLWESHAIMTYLIEKYGKDDSLYPKDLRKRAKINEKLHFENGNLFARGAVVSGAVVLEGKTTITEDDLKPLKKSFEIVESFLQNSKYIAGDQLTVADFSFVTTLVTWAAYVPIQKSKYPKISAYVKRMESLPYYKAIQEGTEAYHSLVRSKLKPK